MQLVLVGLDDIPKEATGREDARPIPSSSIKARGRLILTASRHKMMRQASRLEASLAEASCSALDGLARLTIFLLSVPMQHVHSIILRLDLPVET